MSKDEERSILVALLDDAAEHVIPRLCDLQRRLRAGAGLSDNDALFCSETLEKLRFCLDHSSDDHECELIFANITHQLYEVLSLAGPSAGGTASAS